MQRVRARLIAVTGRDAIERRHAYLLQVVLIVLAIAFFIGALSNVLQHVTGWANLVASISEA